MQSFVSTGRNPAGKNDQLLGVIAHNTHYYVSFKCTNGAGLTTTYEDNTGGRRRRRGVRVKFGDGVWGEGLRMGW